MKMRALSIAVWALLAQSVAHADFVTVAGSGTWGADVPNSIYSAPGKLWSFSFNLPSVLEANPTSIATDFHYFLDGSMVSTTLVNVKFFVLAVGGLFDLNFLDGNNINLYGDEALTSPGLSVIPGTYSANIDFNTTGQLGVGNGSGTVTITSVPEPPSIISGGLGLLALAFWRHQRSAI